MRYRSMRPNSPLLIMQPPLPLLTPPPLTPLPPTPTPTCLPGQVEGQVEVVQVVEHLRGDPPDGALRHLQIKARGDKRG